MNIRVGLIRCKWSLPAIIALILQAQGNLPKDPGPRQGAPGGAMTIGLTGAERELFRKGLEHSRPSVPFKATASCYKPRPDWVPHSTWIVARAVTHILVPA